MDRYSSLESTNPNPTDTDSDSDHQDDEAQVAALCKPPARLEWESVPQSAQYASKEAFEAARAIGTLDDTYWERKNHGTLANGLTWVNYGCKKCQKLQMADGGSLPTTCTRLARASTTGEEDSTYHVALGGKHAVLLPGVTMPAPKRGVIPFLQLDIDRRLDDTPMGILNELVGKYENDQTPLGMLIFAQLPRLNDEENVAKLAAYIANRKKTQFKRGCGNSTFDRSAYSLYATAAALAATQAGFPADHNYGYNSPIVTSVDVIVSAGTSVVRYRCTIRSLPPQIMYHQQQWLL